MARTTTKHLMYDVFPILCFVLPVIFLAISVSADVTLPSVIGDNMVLQQGVELPIWGWADPGEVVAVVLGSTTRETTAEEDGRWSVRLPAMGYQSGQSASNMTISGHNTIEIENILVGEVWVGSGQSNMEFPLSDAIWSPRSTAPPGFDGQQAVAEAGLPQMRLFHVPHAQAEKPSKDVDATWEVCSPRTVADFSAVLYFFGQASPSTARCPIGLIDSSWGGTEIEPWTAVDLAGRSGGSIYNAMIAPLQPFAVCGIIWYQGEHNVYAKTGLAYGNMMTSLISGWRATWGNDELSFYFAQLAPFVGQMYELGQLPSLWQAQASALRLSRTGMVVTTDLVESIRDIHPRQKQPVGERFAYWALAKDYGRDDVVCSGPIYKSMDIEGSAIRLYFAYVSGGLASRDGEPLGEFEVAGIDGKFVPAQAVIDRDTVFVSAAEVPAPMYARFAWYKGAIKQNFVNQADLPGAPFQTYHWPRRIGEGDNLVVKTLLSEDFQSGAIGADIADLGWSIISSSDTTHPIIVADTPANNRQFALWLVPKEYRLSHSYAHPLVEGGHTLQADEFFRLTYAVNVPDLTGGGLNIYLYAEDPTRDDCGPSIYTIANRNFAGVDGAVITSSQDTSGRGSGTLLTAMLPASTTHHIKVEIDHAGAELFTSSDGVVYTSAGADSTGFSSIAAVGVLAYTESAETTSIAFDTIALEVVDPSALEHAPNPMPVPAAPTMSSPDSLPDCHDSRMPELIE